MKKIALLLALLMLFTTLFSCKDSTEESSGEQSSQESSQNGQENSKNESEDSDDQEDGPIKYATVISTGKAYEYTSVKPADQYKDSHNSELTDGVSNNSTDFLNETFVGLAPGGAMIHIVFDLGEDSKRLYKFGVSYLSTRNAGIGPLASAKVSSSDDGKKWSSIGRVTIPKYEDDKVQTAWLELEKPMNSRYIRFSLSASSAWLFIDELYIVANVKGSHAMAEYLENLSVAYKNNPIKEGSITLPDGERVDRTLKKFSASIGKRYKYSRPVNEHYKGKEGMLTDGNTIGASYNTDNWLAWDGGDELTIDLPLGVTYDNIAEIGISMLSQPALGIMLPYYVDFYTSTNNKDFVHVGRVYAPNDEAVSNFTYTVKFENCQKAKYLRYVCAKTDCKMFFCEEISAAYYAEKNKAGTVYEDVVLEPAGEKIYHSSGSSKTTNLVSGLPYQISSASRLDPISERRYNTSATTGILTDGLKAKDTNYGDPVWFKAHLGAARNIYFDLGYQASVNGMEITFLRSAPYAITEPTNISMYLSDDGINWYNVKRQGITSKEDELALNKVKIKLDKPVEARYIKVTIQIGTHAYFDEIEVFGTEKVSSRTVKLEETGIKPVRANDYTHTDKELLKGVEDLVLSYLSKGKVLDKDFFLPYVGYLDKDGKIADTLFDGYLFLPSGDYMPDGYAYETNDRPNTARDWQYLIEQMFKENINFDALDQATAEVKKTLGLTDYKTKVYPTICYISDKMTNFGDIDGDGVKEDLSTVKGRTKVFNWYMDTVIKKFEEAGYENIELGGFYWFHEAISFESDDYSTINACSDAAEKRGYQIFWIPYYQANGFSEWNNYGFSAACMQPNYAFNADIDATRLDSAVDCILQNGMGIEIEILSSALKQKLYYEKYMNYLSYGIKYGYMENSIHMYYAGVTDYYNACYSKSPMARSIYDRTYEFIKGTLGKEKPKAESITVSTEADKYVNGTLFKDETGLIKANVEVSPKHGTVTINTDGTFTYYPNAGFKGTDTFTYVTNDYIVDSDSAEVTVNVG